MATVYPHSIVVDSVQLVATIDQTKNHTSKIIHHKSYIITLQQATNRQEQIKSDLNGLNYTFFFGADKNDFKIDTLKETGIYDKALAIKNHRYKNP